MLFLHGSGERGNDNELQLKHGAGLFLRSENRKAFNSFVIFPQCPAEDFWSSGRCDRTKSPSNDTFFKYGDAPPVSLTAAINLLRKVVSEEGVDPDRLYIAGLSMGGMGTFEAVYRNPEMFAAALPICGGGEADRYDEKVKTAFWVFHGDTDQAVDVRCSRTMVDKLKSLGLEVRYSEYPGVAHNS